MNPSICPAADDGADQGESLPEAGPDRYPEASVDGFTIGVFVTYGDFGDAGVQAPDGGIATLIWETGEPAYFTECIPPDPAGRWGTYQVQLPLPLTTDREAAAYLTALLPDLIPCWRAWAESRRA